SQSKVLITDVLRKELGFRGLAVTDSTLMVGYMQKMPRREALAKTIMAGIDMILFNRNLDEMTAKTIKHPVHFVCGRHPDAYDSRLQIFHRRN
ncbi:MAG: glycoside hydrolase family 3 N-terminal domain-containing protein, partial [Roseburia lenta]|nr:glycoside hydrolase family 3 N-terminal domain-containing protein [Roseburia lenta]